MKRDEIQVKALVAFRDVKAGVYRKVGDIFMVTQERFDEINASGKAQLGRTYVAKIESEKKAKKDE